MSWPKEVSLSENTHISIIVLWTAGYLNLGDLFNISELKAQHLSNVMKIPIFLLLDPETKSYIEEYRSSTNFAPTLLLKFTAEEAVRGRRGILDFISLGLLNAFIKVLCKGHISTLCLVLLETELSKNSWLKVTTAWSLSVTPLPPGTYWNAPARVSSLSVTCILYRSIPLLKTPTILSQLFPISFVARTEHSFSKLFLFPPALLEPHRSVSTEKGTWSIILSCHLILNKAILKKTRIFYPPEPLTDSPDFLVNERKGTSGEWPRDTQL